LIVKPSFWLTRLLLVTVLVISAVGTVQGATNQETNSMVKQTDLTIPASPAFTLLGVTPAQVNQPGYVRDLKLDWIVKEGGLTPNVAIEAQPVWMVFFGHTSLAAYQELPWITRTLSTLSLSLGTAQHDSADSGSLALGARLNLFRKADPLMSKTYSDSMRPTLTYSEVHVLFPHRFGLKQLLEDSEHLDSKTKDSLRAELESVNREIDDAQKANEQRRQSYRSAYERDHWNSAAADIGGGIIGDYANPKPESLHLSYAGMGLWLTGCVGIGKKVMLTAMYRLMEQRDSVHHSLGISFRYGAPKLNGFIEVVSGFDDLGAPSLGYGGEYRLSDVLLLEFGSRTAVKNGVTLASLFQPKLKFSVIAQ
jgi:hypothetical protein